MLINAVLMSWYADGIPTPSPMRITTPDLGGKFTQIPNSLIRNKYLTASQKETWQMVASVCWHGKSSEATVNSMADVAKANDVPYQKFWMSIKRLKAAGGIAETEDGWELLVPDGKPEKAENFSIQEEISSDKRKHTMTQKEVWVEVKKAWNENKPELFLRLDGAVALPMFIALETQAKRLGFDRPDYAKFVAQVCRGAGADTWWSNHAMKFSSIFGFGSIKDRQFENVEKLYKAGAKVEAAIDYACDADILARYHEKGRTELVKVVRFEAEDRHQGEAHLNSIPEEEYDKTTAYIYFAPGKERPVHWSHRRYNTRYLFD